MSYDLHGDILSLPAAADLSSNQFYAVKIDTSGRFALATTGGEKAAGILQNKPDALGVAAAGQVYGVSKAIAGETLVPGDPCGAGTLGKLFKMDEEDEAVLGRCLVGAAANAIFPLLITHEGSAAATSDVHALVASADYSATGQNLMMKAHTVDGQFVINSVAGESTLGVLTNAPASAATGLIKTHGPATATAGIGGVTAGDLLAVENTGKLVTATDGDSVAGYALATAIADATFSAFIMPSASSTVVGSALANTNIWIGSAGGVAAAFAISQDATMTAGGALTIAANAVGATKLGSTVAGTDGAIFKSSQTPDAVTELDVPRGNLLVGTAGDVGLVDLGAAAGNLLVDDGTDPVSVALSGDATLAASGAATLAKSFMRVAVTNFNAAAVIAGNATPLVLVDFSALLAAGLVAAGDALIFHHLIGNISGGTVNYDNNENSIIKYQTAGGGATVSLTLANWFNGGGADSLTDIKQLATVVVPDADEDLVWTMSASPFAAAGDRLLRVACYYSVFTPA